MGMECPRASAERMIQLAKPKLRPAEILTQDSQKESSKGGKKHRRFSSKNHGYPLVISYIAVDWMANGYFFGGSTH